MSRLYNAMSSAASAFVTTFKKSYRTSESTPTWRSLQAYDSFNSYHGRLTRYALYWAMYENTGYDPVHSFADTFKSSYSLYRYTRGICNPVNRLVEIWATVLMGGSLDMEAGDGRGVPSALPIVTKKDAVRESIAQLWRDSLWQVNKTMYCRLGAALGDVALKICEDPERQTVTIDVVHPGTIKWIDKDRHGNIKAYVLEEFRLDPQFKDENVNPFFDPNATRMVCVYTEECYLEGNTVVINTYRNSEPYDWDGMGSTRKLEYGFVPLVCHPHRKMSPRDLWGWAEPHAGLAKVIESDDLASKFNDQIRKISEGAWFITNAQPPRKSKTVRAQSDPSTSDDPSPSREEMKVIYGGNGGTASPLILPLDIQFTTLHLDWMQKIFERDYPELRFDASRVSGDASGKALRECRKTAETRFVDGRAVYDESLARAMRMAIAVGGQYDYPGYKGYSLKSLTNGDLDFRIGERTVFEVDTLDKIEEEQAFWLAAGQAVSAGMPLDVYLERMGWSPDQVSKYQTAKDRDRQQALADQQKQAALSGPKQPPEGQGNS